jgi:hypothetical protein
VLGDESGHRPSTASEHDLLAGPFHTFQDLGKMGFRLRDIKRRHSLPI